MTDRVHPTIDQPAEAQKTAGAIRFAGAASGGWVVPASDDPGQLATEDPDITEGNLNAFAESHSASSFDVDIDPGAAFVGGVWLARDTTTTVTLSSSTNGQDVYVGWDTDASNSVTVGLSGSFANDDPKHKLWTFDTDGSGVTSSTDQRNVDDYRIENADVSGLRNLDADEAFSAYPLQGTDLTDAAVPVDSVNSKTGDVVVSVVTVAELLFLADDDSESTIYDISADSFNSMSNAGSVASDGVDFANADDGFLYLATDNDELHKYDISADSWSQITDSVGVGASNDLTIIRDLIGSES